MKKKILAIALSASLALSMVPMAFAAGTMDGAVLPAGDLHAEQASETGGPQVGDKIWIKRGEAIYKSIGDADGYEVKLSYQVKVVEVVVDELGAPAWYRFEFTSLGLGEALLHGYHYVKAQSASVEDPEGSEAIESEDGGVKVDGDLPEGAELRVGVPDGKTIAEAMESLASDAGDYLSVFEFHDISVTSQGGKWQPGYPVTVTVSTEVPLDGKVRVFHLLDDEAAIADALSRGVADSYDADGALVYYTELSSEDGDVRVNGDGTISFETDSFSVFIVNGYDDESGKQQVVADDTVTMKRGEVKYFKWEPTAGTTNTGRGTWTVESGDEFVDFEVYNSNLSSDGSTGDNTNFYQYYWLKLTAKEPSGSEKAAIQFEYAKKVEGGTDDDIDNGGYVRVQEFFYVQVLETDDALYIDDQIAESGCLVPTFIDALASSEGIEYVWARSDGVEVSKEALSSPYAVSNGAVNVAMDRGGIDAEDVGSADAAKTYTVTALRGTEVVGSAQYTVPYGNELLNGSFECPKSVYVTHDYPNGAPSLYWKTTSESVRDNEICQDIEILSSEAENASAFEGTYGISKLSDGVTFAYQKLAYDAVEPDYELPDGAQCAEINCDAPGALYQDILTYPGTEMYWSLSHRGRNYVGSSGVNGGSWLPDGFSYTVTANGKTTLLTDQKDYMYVIAAPAEQVGHIKTQDQLNELIEAADYPVDDFETQRPMTDYSFDASGKEVTYKGITYMIWEVATDHTAWKDYASTAAYEVGESEYLTRFFFAAGSTSHDRAHVAMGVSPNWSGGNFIDKVSFSDEMPWSIEYYKDGVLQGALTESGTVDLERSTMKFPLNRAAGNADNALLAGTTLVRTEINGRAYSGTTLDWVYSGHNVLQLYYESFGVTVTKQISITNAEDLSDAEAETLAGRLEGYEAPFALYEQGVEDPVATAVVKIDAQTLYGSATFADASGQKFNPETEKTYVIKEGELPSVEGLSLTSKAADSTGLTGSLVYAHTAINVYELRSDLVISKAGVSSVDDDASAGEDAEERQSTLFSVRNDAGVVVATVAICGEGSVTVRGLPLGNYLVTEEEAWSWRYTPISVYDGDRQTHAETLAVGGWSVCVDLDGNSLAFDNVRDKALWLSGDNIARNVFDGK